MRVLSDSEVVIFLFICVVYKSTKKVQAKLNYWI